MKTFALRMLVVTAVIVPLMAFAEEAAGAQTTTWGLILQGIIGLVGLALTVLLSIASVAIAKKTKDARFGAILNQLWMIVQSAVSHAEAELRPKFQKALADGHLSTEEAAALKADVLKLVKETAAKQLQELMKTFGLPEGVLSTMLSGLVERAVSLLNSKPAPTLSPMTPPAVAPVVPSAAKTPPIAPPR